MAGQVTIRLAAMQTKDQRDKISRDLNGSWRFTIRLWGVFTCKRTRVPPLAAEGGTSTEGRKVKYGAREMHYRRGPRTVGQHSTEYERQAVELAWPQTAHGRWQISMKNTFELRPEKESLHGDITNVGVEKATEIARR